MVLAGLRVRTFNCRVFWGLSLLSLPSALLLLNPPVFVSSIGTTLSLPSLSLRVLLFLRARLGGWGGSLRVRFEARTVKREWRGLGFERTAKERKGLRGVRRGKEEWTRRRKFVTWGIVIQFIGRYLILAGGLGAKSWRGDWNFALVRSDIRAPLILCPLFKKRHLTQHCFVPLTYVPYHVILTWEWVRVPPNSYFSQRSMTLTSFPISSNLCRSKINIWKQMTCIYLTLIAS